VSLKWKLLAGVIGLAVLSWLGGFVWDYFDPDSIAHVSMRYQLKLFGSAMYEFHSATGKWPASLDDLAQTSLPQRNRLWKESAQPIVFLWPQNLKPDPKGNASVLLAYHQGGLFNKLGRVWVCWGDLRTEHIRESDLRGRLQK
jgi:hypothetical protein